MDEKCHVCGKKINRRYYDMTDRGEPVKVCPKCRKMWEIYVGRIKPMEVLKNGN